MEFFKNTNPQHYFHIWHWTKSSWVVFQINIKEQTPESKQITMNDGSYGITEENSIWTVVCRHRNETALTNNLMFWMKFINKGFQFVVPGCQQIFSQDYDVYVLVAHLESILWRLCSDSPTWIDLYIFVISPMKNFIFPKWMFSQHMYKRRITREKEGDFGIYGLKVLRVKSVQI